MIVTPIRTSIFRERQNLEEFVLKYIPRAEEKSIIIVTSKIVALSEGRTAIIKNERQKEKLIRSESQFAMKTKYVWLTIRDNLVMASAGIDESNGNGKVILLPKNSFHTAEKLRTALKKKYRVKNLGVIITDSRLLPMRNGTVGVALGYAGIKGILTYKGKKDIFGRKFEYQRADIADAVATSAVLVMGEGKEQIPLAIVKNAPVEFADKVNKKELEIDIKEDVYQPLFARVKKLRLR